MSEEEYNTARARMVEMQLIIRGLTDRRVLDAMGRVPRHRFVPPHLRDQAYDDYPLPIGEDQTISQPYMVALMTEALELKTAQDKVLEIGTGSGYQAAVLAELVEQVYSIDRLAVLVERTGKVLAELGYNNIHLKVGDGTQGWPEESPFDAILVTAGAPQIPRPLVEQLAKGGRLVIPVGNRWSQTLTRVRKTETGSIKTEYLGGCRFVKLIGKYGWEGNGTSEDYLEPGSD